MRKGPTWYEKLGISKGRMKELRGIAEQYDWMRQEEGKLRRGEIDRIESGNIIWHKPDPTGNAAMAIICRSYAPRIDAIEDAARAASPVIWREIIENVCRGKSWARIMPPYCDRVFYAKCRMFFVELDKRI